MSRPRIITRALLGLAGLSSLAACPADDPAMDESSTGAETTTSSTGSSSGSSSSTGAVGECATAPIEVDRYFQGMIGQATRLINDVTLADDCTWSFNFVNCDETMTSEGMWTIEGDRAVLTAMDGSDAVMWVDGDVVSGITISPGGSCDEVTVEYSFQGNDLMESWQRGEACLSGPSCCMNCTEPPPEPDLVWCDAAPESC